MDSILEIKARLEYKIILFTLVDSQIKQMLHNK
jgi:hypothetical protein